MAWNDYQYKHHNFWTILYRSVIGYAVVLAVPLLYDGTELVDRYLVVFPLIAISICLVSTWTLLAEYRLVRQAFEVYIRIFRAELETVYRDNPELRPASFDQDPMRPLGFAVGHIVATAWMVLGTVLGLFSLLALSGRLVGFT